MKQYSKLIFCFLCLVFTATSFAQRQSGVVPIPCTNHTASKGKYKILSRANGVELQFDLEIKPKYRTDENFIAIAKEFKEKYCREKQLRVTFLESKKQWLINPSEIEATPLAIYYFGKNTEEKEGITVYKVVNGKVEMRDLNINN